MNLFLASSLDRTISLLLPKLPKHPSETRVLFVPEDSVQFIEEAARLHKLNILDAGHIEKRGKEKRVEILPINVTYQADELAVR